MHIGNQPHSHALSANWLPFAVLLVVAVALQYVGGAYSGAFGAEADESAHYVTSLMVRDYLASGIPSSPAEFAEAYYLHYPRVAFGLWPPLFPVFAGLWMLLFGVDRLSAFMLIACFSAAFGYVTYLLIKSAFGRWRAAASAIFLVALPATQSSAMTFMMDLPQALVVVIAAIAYARYLDSEHHRHAIAFGVFASIAVLIKYNALLLALAPPLAVLLTGRYYLLRRGSFWLPAIIVVAIAGPWYVWMYRMVLYAAEPGEPWPALWPIAQQNLRTLVSIVGPVILGAAGAGAFLTALVRKKDNAGNAADSNRRDGIYVVSVAVIVSTFIFHTFLYPIVDDRYLLPAVPFIILLGWKAVEAGSGALASSKLRRMAFAPIMLTLIFVPYPSFSFRVERKHTDGYVDIAHRVSQHQLREDEVILAAARGWREGILVAEVAMADNQRPRRTVVRATKVLAEQRLMGQEYRLVYTSSKELMNALDAIPVSMAVVESCNSSDCQAHSQLLEHTIQAMPHRWKLLDTIAKGTGDPMRIYRVIGNEERTLRSLRIDMRPSLGVFFETKPADEGRRSRVEYGGTPGAHR